MNYNLKIHDSNDKNHVKKSVKKIQTPLTVNERNKHERGKTHEANSLVELIDLK